MKDGIFKNLILDTYEKAKEGNIVGILYGAVSTIGFSEINDINQFTDLMNPDMLYLKSIPTNCQIDVYAWELENYVIKKSQRTIYIKVKNKPEISIMY